MVELVKFCRRLAQTPPLEGEGEGRLKEWIRNNVTMTFHTASSCSILPKKLNGIVDPQLKVWGNIRVADLSVILLYVGSHTQSVAYALAEQGWVILVDTIMKAYNEK
ncbi:hypothetical protein P692DRAFT_201812771 [Suillus brevipes Sb2]|nr:hypothetical protein P692DRAFT_201812771 [Suillus brevipes Sb2]